HTRHPRVVLRGPARDTIALGVDAHAPKLHALKGTTTQPDTLLAIEDRATAVQPDRHSRQYHDWRSQHQQDSRRHDVEGALGDAARGSLNKTLAVHQPAGLQAVHRH